MGKHPCTGCVDWVVSGAERVCDYIGHTGHARSLICPPGALCTVKSTARRQHQEPYCDRGGYLCKPRGHKCTWDTGLAMELYRQGKNDREIGEAVGANYRLIYQWRKNRGMKANTKTAKRRN